MTNQEIKTVGQTIAQETQIGGNTAARVGGVVEGIGVALDNKDAANGYYQATINGGTITVNAPNYLLGSGGNLRIKMPSAGTIASTLTIGNANAVQLWYNGAAVSEQNTWEADEIISVFYDGTRFMASNSQGGGGKAEKISYDNSQSGLAATDVQGALDEITPELKSDTIKIGQLGNACILDDSSSATTQMTGLQGMWHGDGTTGTTADIRAHLKINAKGYTRMILTTPEGYYSHIHYVNDSNVNMGAVIERWTNGTVSMMLSGQYDIMLNIKYQEAGTTNITTSMLSGITWGVTLISDVEYEPAAPFSMMEKCVNLNGGTSRNIYNVRNIDFSNLTHTNEAAKSRLKLDGYALINTYGCVHINALIPYSAVSADTHIDRVSVPMYDKNRNYLSSLDLGWYFFNGSDVTIDVDLSDETYKDVAYIGLYFGAASAKTSILNSSLDTSNIAIALTLKDDYKGFAANNENIDGNDWERTITELDIIESNYTYIAFTSTTRGTFIIDARLLNDFEANISVTSGSTIKVAIQGWPEYFKSSAIYDSTWITAGSSYTAKNWAGVKYIALIFTYISGNTGIPTLAEIHQYISLSFKSKKKGLIERIEKLDSPCEVPIPVNWRNQLTTTVYMGEKIDISDNVYTYESIGTLQSGVSSRQGGAAYGNYLFQFHNTLATICVFDMSTGTNVDKITLTANPNCHAGSGGFSNTFYDNTDPFPLLYISSMDEKKIFVYRITGTVGSLSISLIQTITLQMPYYLPNITIDAENNRIVIFAYTKNSWEDATDNDSVIMYCQIPSYNNDVTISTFDNIFLVPFIIAEQGAFARYGLLYLSYGNTGSTTNEGGIIIIDYVSKTIRNLIGLLAISSLEPEACVKWNDSIVFTTQSGTVYKLMFN
jgi:hypothetical protein